MTTAIHRLKPIESSSVLSFDKTTASNSFNIVSSKAFDPS